MEMNENRPVAVRLSGVKKMYKLGQIGGGTLRADLQSWWARVRGKEDPNTKIGTDQRLIGKTFMALNGIDLTIYQGEAVGIIGGNGAGKSTMLKLLSRVTAPTEGEIDIYGRITSMLEVGTGFNGEMTGRENIYLNGAILGMTKAEIDAKMEDIIEFSEVREFIDTPVKRYSSGMYVKLAFSVAAHLDSEIMIMDEVLAVGDVNFQQKCLKRMRQAAKQEGRTVLYVSHNMETIRQLCDRCIVLDQGRVIYQGDVESSISVYSGKVLVENRQDYDFTEKKREVEVTGLCTITGAHLDHSRIGQNESFQFNLDLQSRQNITDALLRFVVFNQRGNVIGTAYSHLFVVAEGTSSVTFTFDSSLLAPGIYYADLILVQYDGEIQLRHDIVIQAIAIEIEETNIRYNLAWQKNGWGSVHFPDLQVLQGE